MIDVYRRLLIEKERLRASNKLSLELTRYLTSRLDQIWANLADSDRAIINAELDNDMLIPTYNLQIKLLRKGAKAPTRASDGSVGLDLYACLGNEDDPTLTLDIPGGTRTVIPTGVAMAIPEGHVGLVCPRSGLARHHGLTVLNAPGIIDVDFRGEVGVILHNTNINLNYRLTHAERVAQLVIVPVSAVEIMLVDELEATARGAGGFGSSGAF